MILWDNIVHILQAPELNAIMSKWVSPPASWAFILCLFGSTARLSPGIEAAQEKRKGALSAGGPSGPWPQLSSLVQRQGCFHYLYDSSRAHR